MSGVYWGATALYLLGQGNRLQKDEIVEWVMSCQKPDGGFGGSPTHDGHLLYTLSALQLLALYDSLDQVDAELVASCKI